ncbi:MAG: alpha/beta hydrolase [Dehalococcoidia bacterium]|nr:alpha/beta hydrolase [Dehalococcoidia bacterium]
MHLPDALSAPAVTVCHPHPLYGGDMDSHVVVAVCRALERERLIALRFNFRGVGGSEGRHDGGRGERDDLLGALAYLRSLPAVQDGRLGAAGYSFGARVVLSAGIGGPLAAISMPAIPEALPEGDLLFVTGEQDHLCPPQDLRPALGEHAAELLSVFPGVDHFWGGGVEEMSERVAAFFARTLRDPDAIADSRHNGDRFSGPER